MASRTLFLRPKHNDLLRDCVSTEQLKTYMDYFGKVEEVWLPWKENDGRYFGFVSFKEDSAAKEVVKGSPHTIIDTEVICGFKKGNATAAKRKSASTGVNSVLTQVPELQKQKLTWETYLAPKALKEALQSIGNDLDPAHKERLRLSRAKMYGDETIQPPGTPIVLFHGPPGTGKTYGMKVLASQSGLQAWVLNSQKLLEDSYAAPELMQETLEFIDKLDSAIVFIDEAEALFPRRSTMGSYASVAVKSHQQLLATFLQWSDGLEEVIKKVPEHRPPLLCLATNLLDQIDEAVQSRASAVVQFHLPTVAQCIKWWSQHAQQLPKHKVVLLGWLSYAAGLCFRSMWNVAEAMLRRDAKSEGVHFTEYVMQICCEMTVSWPSFIEVLRATPSWIWTASSLVFLMERLRRFVPRARL